MRAASLAETFSIVDGVVRLAFNLAGSEAEYLLIDQPCNSVAQHDLFEGHDHYVEVKDQFFGRYSGLIALKVTAENEFELGLSYEVPGVGTKLTIVTQTVMSRDILSCLDQLSR